MSKPGRQHVNLFSGVERRVSSHRRILFQSRAKRVLFFFVLGMWCFVLPCAASEYESERYHESIKSLDRTAGEIALGDKIRHRFGLAGKRPPSYDSGVTLAAKLEAEMLSDSANDDKTPESENLEHIRERLRQAGISDYHVTGAKAIQPTTSLVVESLLRWVDAQRQDNWNRFGVALVGYGERVLGIVFLTERQVRVNSMARQLAKPGNITVEGQVLQPVKDLQVYLELPTGRVTQQRPMRLASGAFSQLLKFKKDGSYRVQIVIDRGQGPQVASLMDISVGNAPHRAKVPTFGAADDAPLDVIQRQMLEWINLIRRGYVLAPLRHSERLSTIIQSKVNATNGSEPLRHRGKNGQGPGELLQDAGIDTEAYGENLGRNRKLSSLMRELIQSPAHRQNLLASHYTHVGIGLRKIQDTGIWTVGQLFARLPVSPIYKTGRVLNLQPEFWQDIHKERFRRKLPALSVSRTLMNQAKELVRSQGRGGRINSIRLREMAERKISSAPNQLAQMVVVLPVASLDELKHFAGFVQARWKLAGVSLIQTKPKGLLALIVLGEQYDSK